MARQPRTPHALSLQATSTTLRPVDLDTLSATEPTNTLSSIVLLDLACHKKREGKR